jgi:hypothetical protein
LTDGGGGSGEGRIAEPGLNTAKQFIVLSKLVLRGKFFKQNF